MPSTLSFIEDESFFDIEESGAGTTGDGNPLEDHRQRIDGNLIIATAAKLLPFDDCESVFAADTTDEPVVDFPEFAGKFRFGVLELIAEPDDFVLNPRFFGKELAPRLFEEFSGFGQFGFDRRKIVDESFGFINGFKGFVIKDAASGFVGFNLVLESLIFLIGFRFGQLGFSFRNGLIACGRFLLFFSGFKLELLLRFLEFFEFGKVGSDISFLCF